MTTQINKCLPCQSYGGRCICENQQAQPMVQPHPHAALIKQWADNPSLKFEFSVKGQNYWMDVRAPSWNTECDYRIKPEPEPDLVYDTYTEPGVTIWSSSTPNLRLTFDGETRKLKKAEVL